MSTATDLTSQCAQQSIGFGNTMLSMLLQTLIASQCAISPPELWPKDYGPTYMTNGLGTYDFVVIGAGSAGSVIASRLSENPNWKILVLEAGGDPPFESEIPALFFTIQHSDYNWNYYTEPDGKSCLAFKNKVCYWPRGKMIGGTGSINAMMYVRGNRGDYDSWEEKGNRHWSWSDVYPYFEKAINVGQNNDTRGGMNVNPFEKHNIEIRDMIYSGAAELGLPKVEAVDEGADIGYTNIPGTVKNGRRQSTGKGYLAKVKNRPNLHVIKHAQATKINIDERTQRVTGVTFVYRGEHELTVNIAKEVVLSAGALDSPKVLMLSGIGPENHLKKLGIPVVRNLRVGDNLQDHVALPLLFKIDKSKVPAVGAQEILADTYNYFINQSGSLAGHGTTTVTGFVNTDETSASPYPDIIFHHLFLQAGSSNFPVWHNAIRLSDKIVKSIQDVHDNNHLLIIYAVLLRPKSSGRIRLRSADPRDTPKMFANYLEQPEDLDTILRAVRYQMMVQDTRAYKEQNAEILRLDLPECEQFPFKDNEYWKCYAKYMVTTMYHVAGTVKMGPDTDSAAVLDWRLRVKGINGLRVADASIMPDVVSGNTNAPTIMIAERAADFVKEEWEGNVDHFEL